MTELNFLLESHCNPTYKQFIINIVWYTLCDEYLIVLALLTHSSTRSWARKKSSPRRGGRTLSPAAFFLGSPKMASTERIILLDPWKVCARLLILRYTIAIPELDKLDTFPLPNLSQKMLGLRNSCFMTLRENASYNTVFLQWLTGTYQQHQSSNIIYMFSLKPIIQ